MNQTKDVVDPKSGFNSVTKTFQSLRPPLDLPPENLPLSVAAYAFSLLRNAPWPDSVALIDSATGHRLFYSEFIRRTETLAANLQSQIGLSKGETALVLSPNSVHVPILYFALLTLGVVISPYNPVSTESDIARIVEFSKPIIAFTTSAAAQKLQNHHGRLRIILIDSPEFESLMTSSTRGVDSVEVSQSDLAVVMYSTGTTGKSKGVMLSHRNLIAMVTGHYAQAQRVGRKSSAVILLTGPYFHTYGFSSCVISVALCSTVVVMERYEMRKMLQAIEEFVVNTVALFPPIVVALVKSSDLVAAYNLSSLQAVVCGGSALRKDVITAFKAKFANVELIQGYGLTESAGAVGRMVNPEEILRWGSVGKISEWVEAKIVDLETGDALPPFKQGELRIRGPAIMKGYIGDKEATSAVLVGDGWLRTGDLCYIDDEGFLYVVDRLKELIKYKGYQVSPVELEQLLQSHPEILDAAVIAYPEEEAGQVPMAIVVRQPKSNLGESEVMDFIAKQVATYKKIRRVAFADSIPKEHGGKIFRNELRKIFTPEVEIV